MSTINHIIRGVHNPIVICLEGIDGAGKSTVLQRVAIEIGSDVAIYRRCQKGELAKRCLAIPCVRKNKVIQAIVYTLVAWRNYIKLDKRSTIVLMDRCALSNVCYFFPHAVNSPMVAKALRVFEPPIQPDRIIVIKESPKVAWERCGKEKDLKWLTRTNDNYEHFIQAGDYCGSTVVGLQCPSVKGRAVKILAMIDERLSEVA